MNLVDDIIRRQDKLAADRGTWENHWQEIAERILPRQAEFNVKHRTEGDKRTEKIFDATAALALDRFASAMESMLTPRSSKWHDLRYQNEDMNDHDIAKRYLESVRDLMFRYRYSPEANFASNLHESYTSVGAFGTQVLYTEEGWGRAPIIYKSIHIGECYIANNFSGVVDTVYRKFDMTARQMVQKWGEDKVSGSVKKCLEGKKDLDKKFPIIHAVYPSEKGDKAFDSVYVEVNDRHMIAKGGYYEMPYHVSRHATTPGETWGRGPAMIILPDIKMLNEMSKTTIRAAQKMVDPPLALHSDGVMSRPNLNPGALNPGGLNEAGQQLIQPIGLAARPDVGLEMMQQRREVINDAFWVTLFQILVDSPAMTATEVLQRAQEKVQLIGPAVGRQQSELLGPLIEREVGILSRKRLLPEPPPEIQGAEIEVEYTSPLARMQKAEEGTGTLRTLETLMAMAEIDPTALDILDTDETSRGLADINGMPMKFLRSPDDVSAIRQRRAEEQKRQQQMMMAAQTAEAVGKAAPGMKVMQEGMG